MGKKYKGDIIWKDRRRRFGLPLSFTRYYIKGNRFYLSTGFFNLEEQEMLMYRILDLSLKRSLWDKMCGVGTITLFTADETNKQLLLKKVKHPHDVRDLISEIVEEERRALRIRGREMYGVSDSGDGDFDGEGDLFD
jgi:hypothetical protein